MRGQAGRGGGTARRRACLATLRACWAMGVGAGGLTLAPAGCVALPLTSPSLPLSNTEVDAAIEAMQATPAELSRPVVIISGYYAPHLQGAHWVRRLSEVTRGSRLLAISYQGQSDFASIAAQVARAVDGAFPSEDPDATVEVDVVGISMGGLVARAAAMDPPLGREAADVRRGGLEGPGPPPKRLRIARLMTIGTPHRGAFLADVIALDEAARSMRAASAFLARLDAALADADYTLISYARLNDEIVGARNTSLPGTDPIWAPGPPLGSHLTASRDRRIFVDIARRLRGEEPVGRPMAPPRD